MSQALFMLDITHS